MSTTSCSKLKVAYLGPPASYSHQAALACFSDVEYDFAPQSSIKDAFTLVQSSSCAFAVVPFENSTFGTVVFTLDLLVDRESSLPDLLVCGELYMSVYHCLLGHPFQTRPQQSPGEDGRMPEMCNPEPPSQRTVDFQHIHAVYSHPQALGQCGRYLSLHLPGAERQDVSSTSKAAEKVAEEGPNSRAVAISSSLAAKVNGLEVLAEGIQDRDDNSTRFFILKNNGSSQESHNPSLNRPSSADGLEWKTLVSFTLAQQPSGTLADVLQTFKDRELNLTGIHSRPSLEHAWHYVFLIEVQGKREARGVGTMNEALEELGRKAKSWRWLGSWIDQAEQQVEAVRIEQ